MKEKEATRIGRKYIESRESAAEGSVI